MMGGAFIIVLRRLWASARELAAPFLAGVVAAFGIMTAHTQVVLEIVGPTFVLLTAGLGTAASFAIVMQRMPGLSMSRAALLAASLGTAMTLLSTVTDSRLNLQAETPEYDPMPRQPSGLAPSVGSLDLPTGTLSNHG